MKAPKRILIVEDEGIVAVDLQGRLRSLGFEVLGWVATGDEAVSRAVAERPDLILMDVRLKGPMDGIQAAARIREQADLPVVFLTAHSDADTLARATATEPFGYLLKPFDERALLVAVETALYKADAERRLKSQRAFFGALFDSIPGPAMVVDHEHRCTTVNRAFRELHPVANEDAPRWCVAQALGFVGAGERGCDDCLFKGPVSAALAGAEVRRRRVELPPQVAGRGPRVFLVSASPMDFEGARLAVVLLEDITELNSLRSLLRVATSFAGMVGGSSAMLEVFETVRQVADLNVPVLIEGESGTGKELVARAIHDQGRRASAPFVAVNCGAMPDGLLESELFGHVRGAFTGAVRTRKGRFELAHGGTLFLDEVGDLSLPLQVKLLRVLQEGSFEAVGAERTTKVDVRVISATNKDLRKEIAAGRFREDLFFRLCVMPVTVPPLRDRLADLTLVAEHLLGKLAALAGRAPLTLSPEARSVLLAHRWPGNVRELENVLQFASIKCREGAIRPEHLPAALAQQVAAGPAKGQLHRKLAPNTVADALREAGGNKRQAAKLLGVSRATLYRLLDRTAAEAEPPEEI